jgi:hypothetical protein
VGATNVVAEAQALVLTDAQISDIKTNCTSILSSLGRVHENDALARVRLGREYEAVSTQLMAPMNSRVVLNKLDATALAQITTDFNSELEHFRGAQGVYPDYERTLSSALNINCYDQPVEFFDTVTSARTKREAVAASTARLDQLMAQYRAEIDAVQSKLPVAQGATQ